MLCLHVCPRVLGHPHGVHSDQSRTVSTGAHSQSTGRVESGRKGGVWKGGPTHMRSRSLHPFWSRPTVVPGGGDLGAGEDTFFFAVGRTLGCVVGRLQFQGGGRWCPGLCSPGCGLSSDCTGRERAGSAAVRAHVQRFHPQQLPGRGGWKCK